MTRLEALATLIDSELDDGNYTGSRVEMIEGILRRGAMPWTREKPTQPGWYWWRAESRHARIVHWHLPVEDLNMNHCTSEFAGPLTPPEEP